MASVADLSAATAVPQVADWNAQKIFAPHMAQGTGAQTSGSVAAEPDHGQFPTAAPVSNLVCETLNSAAQRNELPLEFLTRLIWQESRFDADTISPVGAKGIAQFMPSTAAWIGLNDPFDAADAISKSAELLRSLKSQFGNLGLAAAAYNAGPKRVADWLSGHRSLPRETLAYVLIITGHTAQEWATAAPDHLSLSLPDGVPCPQIAKLFANDQPKTPTASAGQDSTKSAVVTTAPEAPWGIQLIGGSSQVTALASYHQLQRQYPTILGSHQPLVIRSAVGRNTYWYRVRIATQTLNEAERLCESLRAAGGSCLVQRN